MTHSANVRYAQGTLFEYRERVLPLLTDHFKELGYPGGPDKLNIDLMEYEAWEKHGIYVGFGAEIEGKVIAYASFMLAPHPHHCTSKFASSLAYYVIPDYRKGRTGIKLIKFAEKELKEKYGVEYIQMHTNPRKRLDSLMTRLGYELSDLVFTKKLGE